jgi:acrosin
VYPIENSNIFNSELPKNIDKEEIEYRFSTSLVLVQFLLILIMRLKVFPLAISLWGVILINLPNQVSANTPLTRAEIQSLRNFVQFIQRNTRNARPARRADALIPGDGLSTGRASLADLRFNDGSLARVGEQAVFQFLPRTRNFQLSNGTVLLLIPPGRGQTRIQTPSAAAAIRGSALFVRYDQPTDTTIVGALTNSGITVANNDASESQELQAGQLLVVVKGKFQGLYDFDLQNFYETSDLVKGLDLTRQNLAPSPDPAIASVQGEILAALAGQSPLSGQGIVENPSFLELSANSSQDTEQGNSTADSITDGYPVNTFVETGELLFNNAQELGNTDDGITGPGNSIGSNPIERPISPPPSPPLSNSGGNNQDRIGGNNQNVGNAGQNPGGGNPGSGNPGNNQNVGNAGQNPGGGNPGSGNPGNDQNVGNAGQNPGGGNPGGGNPGNDQNVGNAGQNPSDGNSNHQNPGGGEPPPAP